MTPQTAPTRTLSAFTSAERRRLQALRRRYHQDSDLFSTRELAHLRFLRWLHRTGRSSSNNTGDCASLPYTTSSPKCVPLW
jgi:hypothetical protein